MSEIEDSNLIGRRARSKTSAGVQMGDRPVDGLPNSRRQVTGVFQSGIILRPQTIVINYDTWPDWTDGVDIVTSKGSGCVDYIDCFVQTDTGQTGWVGLGALVPEF